MDAGINNVIYMELHSGPKMANGTCGKTIVAGTIDRGSTVIVVESMLCKNQYNVGLFNDMRGFSRQMTKLGYLYIYLARNKIYI
jgi:hypothetical protein